MNVRIMMSIVVALLFSGAVQAGEFEDGNRAYARNDYATALRNYKVAASKDNAGAQYALYVMYKLGKGTKKDSEEANFWLEAAAQNGEVTAQINLAVAYEFGVGVEKNDGEAARWYKKVAAEGNPTAQRYLAQKYSVGSGVTQDYTIAHMWWNLAAAAGDFVSIKNRDIVAEKMTPQQIAEAQKLARECQARNFKNCD